MDVQLFAFAQLYFDAQEFCLGNGAALSELGLSSLTGQDKLRQFLLHRHTHRQSFIETVSPGDSRLLVFVISFFCGESSKPLSCKGAVEKKKWRCGL